jgi:hypothetical protein
MLEAENTLNFSLCRTGHALDDYWLCVSEKSTGCCYNFWFNGCIFCSHPRNYEFTVDRKLESDPFRGLDSFEIKGSA